VPVENFVKLILHFVNVICCASAVHCCCLSVSVCLSVYVTCPCPAEMAKQKITQSVLHDYAGTILCQRSWWN